MKRFLVVWSLCACVFIASAASAADTAVVSTDCANHNIVGNTDAKAKAGDKVAAGDTLGLCGNSGNTSQPHLHFHLQNGPKLFEADGLPAPFVDCLSGGSPVAKGEPVHREIIERKP